MKHVGLTGGIGSGKSTVARMLRDLGAVVVDSDEGARAVVEPGTEGFQRVSAEFGPEVVRDGRLDRAALAARVFSDPDALRRLNAIVHPLVFRWREERLEEARRSGAPVVVSDIPLLYENGLDSAFDGGVIVVHVPPEMQVTRLVEGRGFAEADARSRMAAQMPIDEKAQRATYLVDNSGTVDATRAQVATIWRRLLGS